MPHVRHVRPRRATWQASFRNCSPLNISPLDPAQVSHLARKLPELLRWHLGALPDAMERLVAWLGCLRRAPPCRAHCLDLTVSNCCSTSQLELEHRMLQSIIWRATSKEGTEPSFH